jgi:hypothetical protein
MAFYIRYGGPQCGAGGQPKAKVGPLITTHTHTKSYEVVVVVSFVVAMTA